MTQPAAGWYPDPADPNRQIYFDGARWIHNFGAPPPLPVQGVKPSTPLWSKKWIVGAGLAVLALLVIGSLGRDNDQKSTPAVQRPSAASPLQEQNTGTAAPSGPSVAPAGSSVRDGKFEFQVTGTERTNSKEGLFNPEQAKGEFFVVTLRITNTGDDARTFFASNQHLIVNGNKYNATSSLSDQNSMEEINPGLTITAKVAFDIPPGTTPTAVVCHDSLYSGGAQLAL